MNHEQELYEIILHAGNARAIAYEALDAAEAFDFAKAEELAKRAEEELNEAHKAQTKLIQAELNGTAGEKTLLMIHAQDHLMTAMSEQKLIERLIRLVKKLKTP
ncbi:MULTISPECIES: PTS lactose/cellobiose transporter subunit IIA [Laceyella]|jgi:PTS system cellobiose-specific IIA component|uniref:PTS lactose/cellobiose transporter subunit IIA n=2 Tax=Laceyella TaxID=292635 RepID=A0ABY5TZ89_LACSH|nr:MULTISPECIES: PTS lactose/cellobiose transporter subunit IIA [Laceyella]KPC75277.1 PTS mannose transporter subunit IIA [Thermoactinomyces vulgaris]MRG29610.1 PTS lactose/cellobiose transporter subunit IIA [Laceyella tengchongensis]PRZ11711.1 PTS system cellobiose-specific IIA component [Laceyella sediminis]TCW34833.1 PTS system cellobiose-specific IIA component [Laceyella sacchari]UWE02498.1 PTS lactose/cellobiose transporter subunit IIA [Laceyella sacchari]